MKRSTSLFGTLLLWLACPQVGWSMNNADVVKMTKAGLSEETILAAMRKETADSDTSTDTLIALKGDSVSEKVIQQMITLKNAARVPAPAAESAPAPSPAPAPGPAPTSTPAPAPTPTYTSILVPSGTAGPVPAAAVSTAFSQVSPSIAPLQIEPAVGRDYATRYSFRHEKNEHITTNYGRGVVGPINTPVKNRLDVRLVAGAQAR
jgi:hypothetical protein